MDVSLQTMLNVYSLSTGRRMFALGQVMKAAAERSFPDLEEHCAAALKHDRGTRALETQWAAPATKSSPVQPIDVKVDRLLVSLRDIAQSHADSEDEDEELRRRVRAMLAAIFPEGVLPIIQASYVDELSAVDGILETLKGKAFAPLVAELGLARKVKQLGRLAVEYRAALESRAPEAVPFDKVRAARAEGQEMLLQAVAMILGKYPTRSADHVAARTALLMPILEQNEAVRAYLRSRRSVQDVNPETGAIDPSAPVADGSTAPVSPAAKPE